MNGTAIVSVSFNTKKLSALLLWSLHRILERSGALIVMVDNASTDGTTEMLLRAREAGLCDVIVNPHNLGHGPALELAMRDDRTSRAAEVWLLDSDCVVARPDALSAPLAMHPDAAIIGELHWDRWHGRHRHELYSLIVRRSALDHPDIASFGPGGDPAWEMLASAERAGLSLAAFPFTASGHVVHVGRASLAAVATAGDTANPLYSWARDHHEPHFGGVQGARERHGLLVEQFIDEVGPDLDLAGALGA